MNITQLESFKLSDAVEFHDELNPDLFQDEKMISSVRRQIMKIALDFVEHVSIGDLDIEDITLSGSNAAYSYTDHSDIDIHILIDYSKLPTNEVYRELFDAKRISYNDSHDIKIAGYSVELYVQDSNQPHVSLGEYSVIDDRWLRIPVKRRANFDQHNTALKFEKLDKISKLALKQQDLDQVERVLDILRRYRTAGLSENGEFGPENLAYKALRAQNTVQKLFDLRDKLHARSLSMDESLDRRTMSVEQVAAKHKVSVKQILTQLRQGVEIELEHTTDRKTAKEIALDHLSEDPRYYTKLSKMKLENRLTVTEAAKFLLNEESPTISVINLYRTRKLTGSDNLDDSQGLWSQIWKVFGDRHDKMIKNPKNNKDYLISQELYDYLLKSQTIR
jgi:hypothetical protein